MEPATKQELRASMIEFGALLEILVTDLGRCETLLNEANDIESKQFYARVAIRTLFALIEGCIFRLKQMTLCVGKGLSFEFAPVELIHLTEEEFRLDDNLTITARSAHIPLQKNLRFAFFMFAKTCGVEFSLNTTGAGWQAFRASIKVRDRLMHPKEQGDAIITEDEMLAASATSKWFIDSVTELFSHLGYPISTNDLVH